MAKNKKPNRSHLPQGLEILYEDKDILVINKPAGMLTMSSEKINNRTVYYYLTDYVRKGNPKSKNRVFIVHRLDQWTSGVLVFARSQEMKDQLQDQWPDNEKKYIAVVHGKMTPPEGVISSYLTDNAAFVVYSTNDKTKGKLSHTAYKTLKEGTYFSLLEITLLTGRKNQIRVHMADRGHPVAGDRKYGRGDDGCKRLALHAQSLSFTHPVAKCRMSFQSPAPKEFARLLRTTEIPDIPDAKKRAERRRKDRKEGRLNRSRPPKKYFGKDPDEANT